ncbi:MAG: hemerythrin domain-containing protein [Kofleriaceae bacterium]
MHVPLAMGTDILTLLRRDHEDLDQGLATLLDRSQSIGQIRTAIDGVRLGLTAHAEAEDIVFTIALQHTARLRGLVTEAAEAHRQQARALAALIVTPVGTREWYQRGATLRGLVKEHARYEETSVLPAIRDLAHDVYPGLAGRFATERLRQLSMLMPSAPVYIAELARLG